MSTPEEKDLTIDILRAAWKESPPHMTLGQFMSEVSESAGVGLFNMSHEQLEDELRKRTSQKFRKRQPEIHRGEKRG